MNQEKAGTYLDNLVVQDTGCCGAEQRFFHPVGYKAMWLFLLGCFLVPVAGAQTPTATLSLAPLTVTVAEGASQTFTVALSAEFDSEVRVDYVTMTAGSDTATVVDGDYAATSGTLSFAPGELSKTFTVQTWKNAPPGEDDETFTVALSNLRVLDNTRSAEVALAADVTAEVTITDDGTETVGVANLSGPDTVTEGGLARYTLTVDTALAQDVEFTWAVMHPPSGFSGNGTEDADFSDLTFSPATGVSTPGLVTLPAGGRSISFDVPITDDPVVERDESFLVSVGVSLDSAGLVSSFSPNPFIIVTLKDNDSVPVTLEDAVLHEGLDDQRVALRLDAAQYDGSDITFRISTIAGTAGSSDFTPLTSADVTVRAGDVALGTGAEFFAIGVTDDSDIEGDEQFTVVIESVDGAVTVERGVATVTIEDNDELTVGLGTSILNINEGDSSIQVPLVLTPATPDVGFEVAYRILMPSSCNQDCADLEDFTRLTGTAMISGGNPNLDLSAILLDDDVVEPLTEDFMLRIDRVVGFGGALVFADVVEVPDAAGLPVKINPRQRLRITDNDSMVEITVSPDDSLGVLEGDDSGSSLVVSLSPQIETDVTVALTATQPGGTASFALDLESVTFAPGETSRTVVVTAPENEAVEGQQTGSIAVAVTQPTACATSCVSVASGSDSVDVVIADNDVALIGLTAGSLTIQEGSDPGTIPFGAEVAGTISDPVTVTLTLSGTAREGGSADYTTVGRTTLTIPAGTDTSSPDTDNLVITVVDNEIYELEKELTVTMTCDSGCTPGTVELNTAMISATVTIQDDDVATVSFTPLAVVVAEPGANPPGPAPTDTELTLTLSRAAEVDVVVPLRVIAGTATAGGDYMVAPMVTIPAGDTSATVPITVVDDTLVEIAESFALGLDAGISPSGVVRDDEASSATVTILDADRPSVTVVTPATGLLTTEEGAGTAEFTVALGSPPTGSVIIDMRSSDASEGEVSPRILQFTSDTWNQPQTVTVTGVEDLEPDGHKAYRIVLAPVRGTDAAYSGFDPDDVPVTNVDNDSVQISLQAPVSTSVAEGGSVTFTVALSAAVSSAVQVDYALTDGTATAADGDYLADDGTLTFSPGEISKTFTVRTLENAPGGEPGETFTVSLLNKRVLDNVLGAQIFLATNASVELTITDDNMMRANLDGPVIVTEGESARYTVTIGEALSAQAEFSWMVRRGLQTEEADFDTSGTLNFSGLTSDAQMVTIPAGMTSVSFDVPIADDVVVEPDEDFIVEIQCPACDTAGLSLGTSSLGVTLEDNDEAGLELMDVTVTESDAAVAVVTARLTPPTVTVEGAVTMRVFAVARTAVSPTDFPTVAPLAVEIPSGMSSGTADVAIENDDLIEGDEQFTLVLDPNSLVVPVGSAVTVTRSTATATIEDDDDDDFFALYWATTGVVSVTEGNQAGVRLGWENEVERELEISYVLEEVPGCDGGGCVARATSGEDFPSRGRITAIAPGGGPRTLVVRIPTQEDEVLEQVEDFQVRIIEVRWNGIGAVPINVDPDRSTLRLRVDDDDMVELVASPDTRISLLEGDPGEALLTLSMTAPVYTDVTVTLTDTQPPGAASFTLEPPSVTFAPGETSKTVAITAPDNAVAEGEQDGTITIAVDPAVTGVSVATGSMAVGVDIADDDVALVSLEPGGSVVIDESVDGMRAVSFRAVISAPVATPVTVELSATGDTALLNEDFFIPPPVSRSLTIPANAMESSDIFTVTAQGDAQIEGDEDLTVAIETCSAGCARGAVELNVLARRVKVIIRDDDDDDPVMVSLAPLTAQVDEGGTQEFTVALSKVAQFPVEVLLATSNGTAIAGVDYTVLRRTLRIDAGDTSATVTVRTIEDREMEDAERFMVNLGAAALPAGVTIDNAAATATVTILDKGNRNSVTVTPAGGLVTTEQALGTDKFRVALDSEPVANVVIQLRSSDVSEGLLSTLAGVEPVAALTLTFTPDDWNTPQEVTVTGVEDNDPDGDQSYMILLEPITNSDTAYDGVDPVDVAVTNTDNDSAGLVVTAPDAGVATTEAGGTVEFTVALSSPPAADVVIAVSSSDEDEGTVSPPMLTFAPADWDMQQTVTVTGQDDNVADGGQNYMIELALSTTTEVRYVDLAPTVLSALNQDDDDRPTTFALAVDTPSVMENAGTRSVTVTATLQGGITLPTDLEISLQARGSAAEGTDYRLLGTRVITIPATSISGTTTLIFTLNNDMELEGPETILLIGAVPGFASAAVSIMLQDGDVPAATDIALSVTPDTLTESDSTTGVRFTVTATLGDGRTHTAPTDLFVELVLTSDASGEPGYEVFETRLGLTIPMGDSTAMTVFTMVPREDDVYEPPETIRIGTQNVTDGFTVVNVPTILLTDDEPFDGDDADDADDADDVDDTVRRLVENMSMALGRALVGGVTEVIRGRLSAGPGIPIGEASLTDVFTLHGAPDSLGDDPWQLLRQDMGFAYALGAAEDMPEGGPSVTIWGRLFWNDLSGRPLLGDQQLGYDGDSYGAYFGIDGNVRENLLIGAALGYHNGELDYTGGGFESDFLSLHPYLSLELSPGIELWGSVGYGHGDVQLGSSAESDARLWSGTLGLDARYDLQDRLDAVLSVSSSLVNVDVDGASGLPASDSTVYWVRGEAETGYRVDWSERAHARPFVLAAVRHDFGDLETDTAFEFGGGLELRWPSLEVHLRGRLQVNSTANEEQGISGTVRYDSGGDGRGLQFSLSPELGAGTAMRLDTLAPVGRTESAAATRAGLRSELGYSLLASSGGLHPYGRMELSDQGRRWSTGLRVQWRETLELELETERYQRATETTDHGALINTHLRF